MWHYLKRINYSVYLVVFIWVYTLSVCCAHHETSQLPFFGVMGEFVVFQAHHIKNTHDGKFLLKIWATSSGFSVRAQVFRRMICRREWDICRNRQSTFLPNLAFGRLDFRRFPRDDARLLAFRFLSYLRHQHEIHSTQSHSDDQTWLQCRFYRFIWPFYHLYRSGYHAYSSF